MKYWKVKTFDKETVNSIAKKSDIAPITAMLLNIRNMDNAEEMHRFLYEENELDDPFLMADMDKAVSRITQALENHEKICIYGDYDADGVTSTALLYDYLTSCGADVIYYIPSREAEGYGMNKNAVDRIYHQKVRLIVTVDNGISANQEISHANSLGMDVVVTDHHTPPEILPEAVAIVNPHRKDCLSEFKHLSGVGVAFKLIMALEDNHLNIDALLERYSDIVALGTIGDVVSLTGENRLLVKNGLKNLIAMHNKGITALLDTAGLKGNKKLTANKIAFTIVPRINACGRLALSEKSVQLMLTEDDNLACEIAEELSQDNTQRQNIEKEILEEVKTYIENNPYIRYLPVMVISGENWHQGVIGIVSSRIKDIYGKPNIIITIDGENAKGSGRSIEGFSLIEAITSCKDLFSHFGGHPMAVGLSMKTSDIEEFSYRLNAYAMLNDVPFPVLSVDCKINPQFLNIELAKNVAMLEPFGAGNPMPVFGVYNMTLNSITPLGGNKHLRLAFQRESVIINVMQFFMTPEEFPYVVGDVLDLAVTVDINDYNNRQSVSIIAKDMKFHSDDNLSMLQHNRMFEKLMNSQDLSAEEVQLLLPSRENFVEVFRFIRKVKQWHFSEEVLFHRLNSDKLNYGRLQVILTAMYQLSLIAYHQNGEKTFIEILPFDGKTELENADIMKRLHRYL